MLKPGDRAPGFELLDQFGKKVKLTDFRGKKLLLYFYPRADTQGCTKQACSIRDSKAELINAGVAYLGISPDAPMAQEKFDRKYGLNFPLLADEDHKVAEAYRVWGQKSISGKKRMGIIRSSFLIDENGNIQEAWYGIKPKDTVPKALEVLSAK